MLEEQLGQMEDTLETMENKFYGVMVGQVINPLDPLFLGRVQVRLPSIDALDLSPWARVAVPMAGLMHGTYFIPNIGDQVLVAFEHGDLNAPYIIGSLWNAMAPPPIPNPIAQVRTIRTPIGNQIMFSEVPPQISIQAGPTAPKPAPTPPTPAEPATIYLNTTMIHIALGLNQVIITPVGVQIIAGTNIVNLAADGITLTSTSNINLIASGTISMLAGGGLNMMAPLVKIN